MQAITIHNEEDPAPRIEVRSKIIGKVKRWGISLPRGTRKPELFILLGESDSDLICRSDNTGITHPFIERVGIFVREAEHGPHFLIVKESFDNNPPGTALVRLIVDSGIGGRSTIQIDRRIGKLSLHTYSLRTDKGPISRSDLLAILRPGETIHAERHGHGIVDPFGTIMNRDGEIVSSWSKTPS